MILFRETCATCIEDAVVALNPIERRGRGKRFSWGMRRVSLNSQEQKMGQTAIWHWKVSAKYLQAFLVVNTAQLAVSSRLLNGSTAFRTQGCLRSGTGALVAVCFPSPGRTDFEPPARAAKISVTLLGLVRLSLYISCIQNKEARKIMLPSKRPYAVGGVLRLAVLRGGSHLTLNLQMWWLLGLCRRMCVGHPSWSVFNDLMFIKHLLCADSSAR